METVGQVLVFVTLITYPRVMGAVWLVLLAVAYLSGNWG